jgi:uncharacterized paraquat-inducible protein A
MLVLLFWAAIVVAIATSAWSLSRSVNEPKPHSWRCPLCGKKLRYPAGKAGQSARCPGCHQRLTLPATPQALQGGPAERYQVGRKQDTQSSPIVRR